MSSAVAPLKALCSERYQDWSKKFSPFNLKCMEITGDTDVERFPNLNKANIILTTPVSTASWTQYHRCVMFRHKGHISFHFALLL